MKVLLFAPSFETPAEQMASYPLGIAYLGAVLKKEGHIVKAYDFIHKEWKNCKEKVKKIIKTENPEIIGVSCMTTNRTSGFELAELAKQINPDVKIIFGGVHPSVMYHQILEKKLVDYVIIGEGEDTIVELVEYISKKPNLFKLRKIKGIAFKCKKKIIKNEIRPFIKNLDSLPYPNHHYFENNIKKNKTFFISTSRGCPFACKFCSTSVHWGRMKRQRSVKSVINEIKMLKKKYPFATNIIFNDDEFILNKVWITEFCKAMIHEKINLLWWCCARVTSISEEIVVLLKKAGCSSITLGIESGSPKILKYIHKEIDKKEVIKAFDVCEKNNLQVGMFLIVGLPGENDKTINETINLLKNISSGNMGFPGLFQIFPGNETYNLAKKQGFIFDDYWLTNKQAPFYTYENSRRKLLYWSFKISFFHKFYRGELLQFLIKIMKDHLKYDKLIRTFDRYFG
jgi:anaerobic magnesium-protoporphyrin IX monomethyl ester cyclase